MKKQLIDDICLKLNELHIPFTLKDGTYIYVNTEFYDIGYGTEPKIVLYELSVFIDEPNQAVFMYVKTGDKPVPQSGSSKDTGVQPTTIFRKVRHVCEDAEGKVTVISIDLGEVPNTVKNTAFKYGWKFSTALNLNKFYKTVKVSDVRMSEPDTFDILPEQEPETPVVIPQAAPRKKGVFKRLFGGK